MNITFFISHWKNILKGFKFHIEQIKYLSSIYIMNFKMSLVINWKISKKRGLEKKFFFKKGLYQVFFGSPEFQIDLVGGLY
jgi:hypothetical protein